MRRIENIYILCIVLLLLVAAFTYLVEDVNSYIIYFVIATACTVLMRVNKYLIAATFAVYVIFAVVAQLVGAEWFYHDMPERIDGLYILMSSVRAFLFITPISSGVGVSWVIDRYMKKPNSN